MKNQVIPGQVTFWDFVPTAPRDSSVETGSVADKPVKTVSKMPKLSPIESFIKENNGIVIEDCITVTGKDFKDFCRRLKAALKKEAKPLGMDVTLRPNHYDMSGYFSRDGKYVYWSFSVMRGDMPTYLDKSDCCSGVLYRTAKSEKDSIGGPNNFTDLAHLVDSVYGLIA